MRSATAVLNMKSRTHVRPGHVKFFYQAEVDVTTIKTSQGNLHQTICEIAIKDRFRNLNYISSFNNEIYRKC
jgi:hypothetical protein